MTTKPTVVHIVPAFHYDVAYCKTFKGYLPHSLHIIREGLKLLRRNKDFTFCIEQVILLREYWKRYLRDRRLIQRFAQAGRLHFAPGMFTMPDSNIPSGESFIRNALMGREWLQHNLGVVPDCCWMADIFGHNPQSPQLAQTCGFKSYMFERGKSGSWDTTFLWQGLDGSTIPTHWEVDTYFGIGLGLLKDRPYEWIKNCLQREVIQPLKAGAPCPEILLSPYGGDFLVPKQADIDFMRAWNRKEKDIRFVFSTPASYFAELERRQVRLKKLADDMNPLLEGCWSSRIRIKQYNRRLEESAATLELLEVMTGGGHAASVRLWESIVWNAFHDIICGSLVKKAAREALAVYATAEKRAEREIRSRLSRLARRVLPKGRSQGILLFNSLPYPRRAIVAIPGKNNFITANLPATGFCLIPSVKQPEVRNGVFIRNRGMTLENRFLRVAFAPNGTIGRLYDKVNRQELAVSGKGMNTPLLQSDFGDLWIVGTGPVNGHLLRTAPLHQPMPQDGETLAREGRTGIKAADADSFAWPKRRLIHQHALQGTVEIGYPEISFTTQVTLCADEPLVRFRTVFMPKGKRYRLRVAFPTTVKSGRIRHSVPFGHLERSEGEYATQGWIDYADSRKGLLLLNRGLPGNNVTDGVMMLSLFRAVSMESQEKIAWYEEGIEQVFEYALMPFNPKDSRYNPAHMAALFNRPVISLPVRNVRLDLVGPHVAEPYVELKGDCAELSCVKKEGNTLVLRLWESCGRNSPVTCIMRESVKSCVRTSAAGTFASEVPCTGRTISLTLRPFEIATLRLTLR